jgi:hypothetical protein
VLSDIRAGQWRTLSKGELTGPGSVYAQAKASGFGDVRGITEDTPARQRDVMERQACDLDHLVWLAGDDVDAYVPRSIHDVIADRDAFENRDSVPDDRPVTDLSPMVTPNRPVPQPNRSERGTAEREAAARSRSGRTY